MGNKLKTVDAETLLSTPMSKTMFIVDGLISQGVNVISGASKIGKSWLMLWLGLQVAQGNSIWGLPTLQCDVLYLSLEDTQRRIKDRLYNLTDSAPDNLYFAVTSGLIGGGLEEQITDFLTEHSATKLVIIDTLQKVRDSKGSAGKAGMYGNDYDDISSIKRIADGFNIAILLVHHLRKLQDSDDPFNDVSGSTGIIGAADTNFILRRKRSGTWERGNDRTNSSFVIMGVAGIGKSTVVKHIMLSEYMKGTKILCIDPESEYKDMCRNLNGSWLNAGGGKNGRSNLLQIRPAPRDDDDETDKLYTDEGNGMSDMALHMKTLEIEFSLYLPSLTDMQKAILKQTIIELYNQFGIFWETDIRQLKATDFPILSDLHALLEKKAEANKENPVYRDLAMLLYDAAAGSDSFLWNGHTTLEANSRFICLDTHDLQNASDNVKRTQYLNLLSWCWEEMSRDRNERCLLVCDEAYLMIDPQVPQSLVFLRNVEKRARK